MCQCASVGFFFNEFTFGIKGHEQVFRYFSLPRLRKIPQKYALTFFLLKKSKQKKSSSSRTNTSPAIVQSGKYQNSEQMNLPLKQLKFSSLFHNVGPEAFLLGPGVHKNKIYSFSRNHTSGHLEIEYTTLNKAFLKLHENEQMLSLAECSSASISFSKVDKTLRIEAELSNQR